MLRQFQMLQLLTVALLVFYVVAIVGCGSSSAASPVAPSGSGAATVQIAETDNGFEPQNITVERGQVVHVTFTNKGQVMHNLRIAGSSVFAGPKDVTFGNPIVQPGQSASGDWTAPNEAGKRLFRCDVHPNHTGTITIR